ncbi:retrovirus-related pol polyprotein from transposon TNT 1-94 [Tanacetum coccineum]
MEAAVDQCFVDKNAFEIQIKQLSIDNVKLLNTIMSQGIMHIAVHSVDILDVKKSCDNFRENQNAPTNQLFEINELKAQSQENDTVIKKLKDRIRSLSGKDSVENIKKDIDEIETINNKLEHSVTKLLSENENLRKKREHLKLIYKDQFDSIRKTRVQSKEHCDSLISQINAKSVENSDLNAQLQEKVFAFAALKNELRKLKGKNVVDTTVSRPSATIAPGIFKLDIEPISRRLKNNKDAHEVYFEKTIENTDILRGLEVLVYVSKSCPSLTKPCEKLFVVTPMNKDKKVRFAKPVTSSSNIPKQTDSRRTKDSNKPLLTSTGVNTTTSASGSKPSGNTKKNRISRPPRSPPPKVSALPKASAKAVLMENLSSYDLDVLFEVVQIVLWYLDSRCSKHMIGNRSQLIKFVSKFLGTIRFRNDHIAKIMGYGDYKMGNVTISRVYFVEGLGHNLFSVGQFCTVRFRNDHIAKIMGYGDYKMGNVTISRVCFVEGLGHNLFSMGQFCDSDLEVAFRKHTCFIRDLKGVDLLKGSRGSNLYTLSLDNLLLSSPICLLSKVSKTKSWLWHQRLSHLNFDYITSLSKQCLVRGLPKLKYQKDYLCSACALGKSKKHSHKPKAEDSIQEKLYLLHMDLCGPMRIQSINGRKYILVIVDDYSRTDNGTEFVNQTLRAYYEEVGISHQTSVSHTLQQNGVVERRNCTLVEVACSMLIFSKAPLFLWPEAVATACYTQNRSLIQKHHNKTPYELLHDRKPDLSYRHVFGALCYPTNNGLVQNIPSSTPYIPPTKNVWEILFQPIFDEYLNHPPCFDPQVPAVISPEPAILTVIPLGINEADHDIEVAHMDNNPYVDFPIPEPSSEESSIQFVIPNNVHLINQPPEHINKRTKDHLLDCYKEALTESYWIEAMQEELNEFECLEV